MFQREMNIVRQERIFVETGSCIRMSSWASDSKEVPALMSLPMKGGCLNCRCVDPCTMSYACQYQALLEMDSTLMTKLKGMDVHSDRYTRNLQWIWIKDAVDMEEQGCNGFGEHQGSRKTNLGSS